MASIAVRVRMRGPTVNRSAGQDAATRSRLQDTAPSRLPQNLLMTFLLSLCFAESPLAFLKCSCHTIYLGKWHFMTNVTGLRAAFLS